MKSEGYGSNAETKIRVSKHIANEDGTDGAEILSVRGSSGQTGSSGKFPAKMPSDSLMPGRGESCRYSGHRADALRRPSLTDPKRTGGRLDSAAQSLDEGLGMFERTELIVLATGDDVGAGDFLRVAVPVDRFAERVEFALVRDAGHEHEALLEGRRRPIEGLRNHKTNIPFRYIPATYGPDCLPSTKCTRLFLMR